jgi:endonuclease-3
MHLVASRGSAFPAPVIAPICTFRPDSPFGIRCAQRLARMRRTRPDPMKKPHRIPTMLNRIRKAVTSYPKAAMFELAEQGFDTPFQQLLGCILSIRTRDEVSLPAALKLLRRASTPAAVARLSEAQIDGLIGTVAFHRPKAGQLRAIARRVEQEFGGELPCSFEVLTSLSGVGPKCANLTLGIACNQPSISVDVHVHRITNRWGYVQTTAPGQTLHALQKKLPRRYWIELNALLVPFGKHICTGQLPKCSTCPVLEFCQQVGVTRHR